MFGTVVALQSISEVFDETAAFLGSLFGDFDGPYVQ